MLNLNRRKSYLLFAFIYVLTAAFGILVYIALPFEPWLSLLIADIAATAFIFIFSLALKNASVYDPYWSVQPIVIVIGFAIFNPMNIVKVLLITAICIWGLRLTANWAYTFKGSAHQDWRYTMLKEKTGRLYPAVNFLGIHLVPTLIVYLCTVPAVYVILDGGEPSYLSLIFFVTALLSVLLQGVSDCQMHSFRRSRDSQFMRRGLWKYSRHPNYLGEILMWWSVGHFAFFYLGFNPLLLVGALSNTLLFLFVSIPMADKRQSRKEGFSEYKLQTRMLLPIKK